MNLIKNIPSKRDLCRYRCQFFNALRLSCVKGWAPGIPISSIEFACTELILIKKRNKMLPRFRRSRKSLILIIIIRPTKRLSDYGMIVNSQGGYSKKYLLG